MPGNVKGATVFPKKARISSCGCLPVYPDLHDLTRRESKEEVTVTDTERLEAREIESRYAPDAPPILARLTLGLRHGEFVGVVGPNGSGKSTLVRALSRTLRPARGAVLLDGRDLYANVSARESAQQIGVVPQDTQAAFDFTVREVVGMGRAPRLPRRPFAAATPGDARAVQEALRLAGIEPLSERLVTTLSGGERQRAVLARALAQEPDVLLLDEPTAHLDLRHQTQMLALARSLATRTARPSWPSCTT